MTYGAALFSVFAIGAALGYLNGWYYGQRSRMTPEERHAADEQTKEDLRTW